MDPFGTGYQVVTENTQYWPGSSIINLREIYTEDGTLVLWELYDEDGNLKAGFYYEDGKYYEWVPNDPDDPSKGGEWQEKEKPGEGNP